MVVGNIVNQLTETRRQAGMSQQTLARLLGWSQPEVSRFERLAKPANVTFVRAAEMAAVLGMELGAALYAAGLPLRDKGHQMLIGRFRALLNVAWKVAAEVPLPGVGDPRAWDLVLRVAGCVVGVECETRIRDVQALARRVHRRQRDGGVDVIVLVLAETAYNRRVLPDLLTALGPEFATPARQLLSALRTGQALPGSGVVLA